MFDADPEFEDGDTICEYDDFGFDAVAEDFVCMTDWGMLPGGFKKGDGDVGIR